MWHRESIGFAPAVDTGTISRALRFMSSQCLYWLIVAFNSNVEDNVLKYVNIFLIFQIVYNVKIIHVFSMYCCQMCRKSCVMHKTVYVLAFPHFVQYP